jgi:protein-tyrosine phosphatase
MVIDMHAHILPKTDHGSDSMECSIQQCKKAAAAGVETIVATPHFYMDIDIIDYFLMRREEAYINLTKTVKYPKILKAAEVTLFPGIEKLDRLDELCIEGTDYILLEMPNTTGDDWVYQSIFEIKGKRGLRPIIAHIDRCSKEKAKRLLEMDVLIQVNAAAFTSFKKSYYVMKLFKKNKVHVLGSDAHGFADEYLDFHQAQKKLGSLADTVMSNAERIIHNEFIKK